MGEHRDGDDSDPVAEARDRLGREEADEGAVAEQGRVTGLLPGGGNDVKTAPIGSFLDDSS
ncbi:MAG: hypothetical protein H0V77_00185 [Actinobacteria bacterium]|nr:hypothetical protein [Actinomycetota bacterium]